MSKLLISVDTEGRGRKVKGPENAAGKYVGTLNGVQWVAWGDAAEFRKMCGTFDEQAKSAMRRALGEKESKKTPTAAELRALGIFAKAHGRGWRDKLRKFWMSGATAREMLVGQDTQETLWQVRNRLGEAALKISGAELP